MARFVATLDCPHCGTKRASMVSRHVLEDPNGVIRCALVCSHCYEFVVALLSTTYNLSQKTPDGDTVVNIQDPHCWIRFQTVLYPRTLQSKAPKSVPAKIAAPFEEAVDNLARQRFETAVLLCGKALDLATRTMDKTWSLEKRLKALAAEGKITHDMADWAGEIRLDRNTAIHEDHDFDTKSASNIINFTEAFLTYIFTLPAMVAEHRTSRKEAPKSEK